MIAWDDLTELERLRCIYSDAHKDIIGCRPNYDEVDAMTEEEIRERFKQLTENTNE
jgi:hypothetical protein